jgi:polyisoprenoid-binding protein YceI
MLVRQAGLVLAALLGTAAGAGCSSAPKATLVTEVPEAVAASSDAEKYELAAGGVTVEADVSAGSSHTLRFTRSSGVVVVSPSRPEASTIDVTVDTTNIETTIPIVADIAKDQFLHVYAHPTARFVSRALRKTESGYQMYGDFDFHGTKKSLVVPVAIEVDECRVHLSAEFEIDRRVFGAVSDGSLDPLVSDAVEVRIRVDAPRKNAPAKCSKNVAKN